MKCRNQRAPKSLAIAAAAQMAITTPPNGAYQSGAGFRVGSDSAKSVHGQFMDSIVPYSGESRNG